MCGQILEKVSPNPLEIKSVAAQTNTKKNRSMEFLPGRGAVVVSAACTDGYFYCVHSGQMAGSTERREPRLYQCNSCSCESALLY